MIPFGGPAIHELSGSVTLRPEITLRFALIGDSDFAIIIESISDIFLTFTIKTPSVKLFFSNI
jgi:hypothetical protein